MIQHLTNNQLAAWLLTWEWDVQILQSMEMRENAVDSNRRPCLVPDLKAIYLCLVTIKLRAQLSLSPRTKNMIFGATNWLLASTWPRHVRAYLIFSCNRLEFLTIYGFFRMHKSSCKIPKLPVDMYIFLLLWYHSLPLFFSYWFSDYWIWSSFTAILGLIATGITLGISPKWKSQWNVRYYALRKQVSADDDLQSSATFKRRYYNPRICKPTVAGIGIGTLSTIPTSITMVQNIIWPTNPNTITASISLEVIPEPEAVQMAKMAEVLMEMVEEEVEVVIII